MRETGRRQGINNDNDDVHISAIFKKKLLLLFFIQFSFCYSIGGSK